MPAIQLARLRLEVADLVEHFHQPEQFVKHLKELLEFYADRTRRPKLEGTPPPILKSFSIPQPLFRLILIEISPLAEMHPEATLNLADTCWAEPIIEFRQIAIHLLALISPSPSERILDRFLPWLEETVEESLIQQIFDVGLTRLRNELQNEFLILIEKWLVSKEKKQQVFGLIGILSLINTNSFDNLPIVFRLLKVPLDHENKYFRPYLLNIFRKIAQISSQETGYFIKEALTNSPTMEIQWLARHSISFFPAGLQSEIKDIIRLIRKKSTDNNNGNPG